MARTYSLIVRLNGTPVSVLHARVNLRLDGQTVASVELDPTSKAALGVNETDTWDIALSYVVPTGGTTEQQLVTSGRARGAAYSQRFRGGAAERNIDVVRTIQIADRFAAFRDYAPDSTVTRLSTDSHRELAYVCGRIGLTGAMASCARVPIERIDYTRDSSYWEILYPYLAPFDPLILLDPATAALRVVDPTVIHSASPRNDAALTLADYNPAEWATDLRPIVTQVRVDYRAFGQAGLGPKVTPTANRTEEEVTEEDDGSMTRTWTRFADLFEDTANPTTPTRSVVCEQGVARTDSGSLISETVTTMKYRADYGLLVETETVVTGTADLPIVGEYLGELERTVEERDYEADTIVPGRYLLKKTTATTSGLYVFNYSSADPDGTVSKTTATPVVEASVAGTVDVNRVSSGLGDGEVIVTPNASTSQQFATDRTRVIVETYQRSHASNVVTVAGTETDSLRGKVIRTWQRLEIGDNTVFPVGRTAFVYVNGSETYGERKAAVVNAQQIGLPIGRQIAARILAQSGQPIRTARITLTRPDYRIARLGYLVKLHTDAPYSMSGLYFVRGITFEANPPSESEPPLRQTIELQRSW